MIETVESRWQNAINRLHDSGQLAVIPPTHLWVTIIADYEHAHRVRVPEPAGFADGPAAHVRVNGGVWQTPCPLCGSTQHASRDEWFYCATCRNAAVAGRLLPQVWPTNADQIEQVLLFRPRPKYRHWHPGERIEDLRRQDLKAIRLELHKGT